MFEDRDARAPAWAWLRGFGWLLVAWPLLSLLAVDQFDFREWEAIVAAVLGPAAVGLVLLGIDWLLTKLFGRRAARAPQAVPSTLRDVSNLGVATALLVVVDCLLVTAFDHDPMIRGGDPRAAKAAVTILVAGTATALAFRGAALLVHGGARRVDMGEGWDRAPNVLRFLGYLTLIPMLLVCTVMIDYELHRRPGFGWVAWVVLPALLWLGLRSATARAPRWWARNPWDAWMRQTSLALPWWIVGVGAALGFVALCLLIPVGLVDDDLTTRGRIVGGIVLVPLGLIVLFGVGAIGARSVPALLREWSVARRLARGAEEVAACEVTGTPGQVRLRLRGGGEMVFEAGEDAPAVLTWLRSRAPPRA